MFLFFGRSFWNFDKDNVGEWKKRELDEVIMFRSMIFFEFQNYSETKVDFYLLTSNKKMFIFGFCKDTAAFLIPFLLMGELQHVYSS